MAGDDLDKLSFFSGSPKAKAAPEGEPSASPSFFDKPTDEPPNRLPLSNAPDESLLSGTAKNVATTIGKGLAHVPGMAGDLVDMGLRVGASAVAKMPWEDRPREQIEQQWRTGIEANARRREAEVEEKLKQPGLSDREKLVLRRSLQNIRPPPTGEDIYQKGVAPTLGEYTPTTPLGEFGRAAGEAAIPSVLMPGMGPVKSAVSGATAGVAGHTANKYLGWEDPLALFGASAVGAGVPTVLTAPVKRLRPISQSAKELEAGKRIVAHTDNPEAALAEARGRAHLPDEPLAEATQDPSHAAAQDTILSTGQPDLTRTLQQRRAAQNTAILEKLRGLGPIEAEPTDVAAGFQKHLDALNAARDEHAAAVPQGLPANEAGAALRAHVQAAADKFHENLTALKKSVPDVPVWTQDLGDWVRNEQKALEQRIMKTRSPLADQIYDMASKVGDVTNLHDLIDLDQSVTAMMKKANSPMNVDAIGHGQLVQLKGQIKTALDQALENQHKWQQEAVARGELAPEQSLAHNLQREHDQWLQQRQQAVAGTGGPGRTGAPAGVEPETVPSVGGAERPLAGGSPEAAGDQGVPGVGDAAERLKTFNKGWGLYRDIYGKGEVGDALERPGVGGQYDKTGAEVANKAFASGPKGYENAQMWLRAGGPEGLAGLKDVVYGRLQQELKGKPLDPKTLEAWRGKYGDALRAIDEAEPGFSKQFDNAAQAQKTVQDFETGSAAKFLKLEHPDDIVAHVGRLMNSTDSATSIAALVDQAKAIPGEGGAPILGGLRRAGAQALENQFRNEGAKIPTERGFEPMIGGARLQKFINERRNTLDALFEPEAVDQMAKVASEIDRSTAVRTAMTTQHGSQTALRGARMRELRQQMDAAMAQDIRNGTQSTFSALALWELLREGMGVLRGQGVEGALSAGVMFGISQAWTRALERAGHKAAATQADIAHLMAQGFASRETGVALMEKALNEHGIPNQRAFDNLARSLIAGEAAGQQSQEREGRAEGGRVGGKPEDVARKMIEAVEKARKLDTERTKPLLRVDDHAVATALAAAGRSI